MQIVKLLVGDVLRLKKAHPCGSDTFRVLRVGSDMRIVCMGCGRDMTLDRIKLERALRLPPIHPVPSDAEFQTTGEAK